MPIFGRFTQRAQRAVAAAQQAAVKLHQPYVGTEHLLLGLLKEPGPVIESALPANVTYDSVFDQVRTLLGEGKAQNAGMLELTPRSKKILEGSILESRRLHHSFVGTEHFWLALLREGEGVAVTLLRGMGVDVAALQNKILENINSAQPDAVDTPQANGAEPAQQSNANVLEKFSRDLTKAAQDGELDPVIGRSTEIERIMQIMSRRTKNNPVL
ncbi:MAG: NDP-hexose 4-ketoreductase, partial [Clostridia bacterium]|nr:NDP-hexose 4-ketoreductase [Clostridia bacterium]